MMTPQSESLPHLLDRSEEICELRKALDEAGFAHTGVLEVFGCSEPVAGNVLFCLFILQAPLPLESFQRLLSLRPVGLIVDACRELMSGAPGDGDPLSASASCDELGVLSR